MIKNLREHKYMILARGVLCFISCVCLGACVFRGLKCLSVLSFTMKQHLDHECHLLWGTQQLWVNSCI